MRKTILFIAMSLDGYIADLNGGVDWLQGQGNDDENIDSYSKFVERIDTILMGWNTYHQIVSELSINNWIYSDFMTYVFTHKPTLSTKQIQFIDENPVSFLKKLKDEKGKDIWICGGANLVHQLMKEDMIDEFYISIIPTLLGNGIRLFEPFENEIKLELCQTISYNGITDLVYKRR